MKISNSSLTAIFTLVLIGGRPVFSQTITPPLTPDIRQQIELARQYPDYFTINAASIRVTLLGVKEAPDTSYVKMQETPRDLNGVLVTIDSIVNIAQKVWNIIEANKPVVNIETKYATAYPEGVTSAAQLNSWSRPKIYSYGFYAENLFGSVMIDAKYNVNFSYNGNYKGKGKYLTAVAVIPTVASVGWGYTFNMSASVPDSTIANVGSDTDPIAAVQLKLSWKMSTVLKEVDGTSVYYVQGDGYFEEIASPFKTREGKKAEDMRSAAPLLRAPAEVF